MAEPKDKTEKKRKYNGSANLKPFTPMNAAEMARLSHRVRQMRKQMRAQMLEAAINEGIDKFFVKALKTLDADGIAVVEKAMKLVGLDYASDEDAVKSGISVKASTSGESTDTPSDQSLKVSIEVIDGHQA
jgi:hypothetical protein